MNSKDFLNRLDIQLREIEEKRNILLKQQEEIELQKRSTIKKEITDYLLSEGFVLTDVDNHEPLDNIFYSKVHNKNTIVVSLDFKDFEHSYIDIEYSINGILYYFSDEYNPIELNNLTLKELQEKLQEAYKFKLKTYKLEIEFLTDEAYKIETYLKNLKDPYMGILSSNLKEIVE